MKDRRTTALIYASLLGGAFIFGGHVAMYAFSGIITLATLVFLLESISTLKWIAYHFNKLFDIMIFALGIYAKFHFTVTLAMAIMFAGLGYTLLYGPYIRETYNKQ
jgi:hypothetical protein